MKYQPGDIVIVKTEDAGLGKCTLPAIVRYFDKELNVYEVNAFAPTSLEGCMKQEHIHWWPVSEKEIAAWIGFVEIQKFGIGRKRGTQ